MLQVVAAHVDDVDVLLHALVLLALTEDGLLHQRDLGAVLLLSDDVGTHHQHQNGHAHAEHAGHAVEHGALAAEFAGDAVEHHLGQDRHKRQERHIPQLPLIVLMAAAPAKDAVQSEVAQEVDAPVHQPLKIGIQGMVEEGNGGGGIGACDRQQQPVEAGGDLTGCNAHAPGLQSSKDRGVVAQKQQWQRDAGLYHRHKDTGNEVVVVGADDHGRQHDAQHDEQTEQQPQPEMLLALQRYGKDQGRHDGLYDRDTLHDELIGIIAQVALNDLKNANLLWQD